VARFLVIDDEETVGRTLVRMLELDGHEASQALSAEAGLQMAADERPDAILLDMRMPVMGGLEFLRRLRQDADLRSLPVGIVTGDYFLADDVTAELASLGALVRHKPMFMDDLLSLARELLGGDAAPAPQ
jgi:CheY-like chemotaxis protein